ncbi:hypothetical protein ANCCAN_02722 [Ancylostoma caninum]|uniref:Uncharacterized protein n=1 Tax=Ancylostoma caninum TaxID=29170 RepID=A0A368H3J3_ANCCA|nr:hypothetical protein ANCCAN_02722 [Ancylostoma caninum]
MLRLLWISSLVSFSTSRYVLHDDGEGGALFHRLFKSDRKITSSELGSYFIVMRMYPEYVPKEVQRLLRNLSPRAERDLLTLANEIRGGYVELSNNPSETLAVVKSRIPELRRNLHAALNMLITTVEKLSANNREAFHKKKNRGTSFQFWIMFFESISAPTPLRTMFLAAFYAEILDSFKSADTSTLTEIYMASPETYRLLRSDFVREFADAAERFARHDLRQKASLEEQDGY